MKRTTTLPLGIDIGADHTRVALVECATDGATRLIACATRATGDDPSAAIAAAHAELTTRERRCVLGLGAPDGLLRTATFPTMRRRERQRAARFEAARHVPYPIAEADVRVVADGGRGYVMGIARRTILDARLAAATHARLRPIAVDDNALALLRAFPREGAVLDAGASTTVLVIPGDIIPTIRAFPVGGRAFTAAVAASLGVDDDTAETRKRSVGLAGAGESLRDELVEQLASALIEARSHGRRDVRSVTLVGNGARLPGLAGALERAVAIPTYLGSLDPESTALPADVVRAASSDWALAYGLALWDAVR